jgi:hypothetical protein
MLHYINADPDPDQGGGGGGAYPFPTSVADSGCLSRISDPDFYPSRITDLGSSS